MDFKRFLLIGWFIFTGHACEQSDPFAYMDDYLKFRSQENVAGLTLDYALAVPEDYYSHPRPMPLIIALHYGGVTTIEAGSAFVDELVLPGLGGLQAIIAAPVSPTSGTWASLSAERAIFGLIDTIQAHLQVDTSRIVIMGYSMGANGAWYYAGKYPSRFAAVVAVSGNPSSTNLQTFADLPIYIIHSRKDEIYPCAQVETAVNVLKSRGVEVYFKQLQQPGHYEIAKFVNALTDAGDWIARRW